MNILRAVPRTVRLLRAPALLQQRASLARVTGRGRKGSSSRSSDDEHAVVAAPPPPAPLSVEDAWQPVTDKATGQIYYWNTITNETTALGAPRPAGPTAISPQQEQQPQQGGMLSGLGAVMAQGFAFGTGSSIAHNVVGSLFGGGGGHSSSESSSGSDDDEFDI